MNKAINLYEIEHSKLRELESKYSKELDDTFCERHSRCKVKNYCLRYVVRDKIYHSEYWIAKRCTEDESCPMYLPVKE